MRRLPLVLFLLLVAAPTAEAKIRVPSGWTVQTVASGVPQPTNLAWDDVGRLWVSSGGNLPRRTDGVWLVRTPGAKPRQVVRGPYTALGITWLDGELFLSHRHPPRPVDGATARVTAYKTFEDGRFRRSRVVLKGIPIGLHGPDTIIPGPDGRLFLGIGSVGNASGPGRVVSFRPSGRGLRDEARGLRNPYGLAWVPGRPTLLVTDNGRDDKGAKGPPDELNAFDVTEPPVHFGFPSCPSSLRCLPPFAKLAPHAAAGGVAVSPDGATAYVAQNGSSFPDAPTGSDVVQVDLATGRRTAFATGFREHDPLGAATGPDGALYLTLWKSGRVVRVARR